MKKSGDYLWLLLILLLGAWLRFHALGQPSLWIDEAYTWYLLRPSWRDIGGVLMLISDTSPLYYVLVRLGEPLLGQSAFALRFLGASAQCLTLPVIYKLGQTLFDRSAGRWAALLLAVSPFAVWYARDARPYGFYGLFAALALWGFWRWAARGRSVWLLVGASAALYLTHYAAALFAFAQAAYLLMGLRRRPRLFRRWFFWQTLAALPTSLYLLAFLLRRQPITANTWIPAPGAFDLLQTLVNYLSADAYQLTWLGVSLAGLAGLILSLGLRPPPAHRAAVHLLLWWLALPMTAAWLLSFRLPAYIDRFFFPQILAGMLLLGAALATQTRPAFNFIKLTAGLCLCAGMTWASWQVLTQPAYAKEDWQSAAQTLQTDYANLPLLAQDSECLLGLLPYYAPPRVAGQVSPAALDTLTETTVVVMRSLHDSNHGLTKSALYEPLTDSSLATWCAAHPDRVRAVHSWAGVGLLVIEPGQP